MKISKLSTIAAALTLAVASASPLMAQSTRNVGGNQQNNIGTNNIGGGGGGGQVYGCVNVTLAGATHVRVCGNTYTARLGNIICSGYVSRSRGTYLQQAPCNQAGQNFLGGSLNCQGSYCNWYPSSAGRAQGFQPEYVSAYYN